MKTVKNGRCVRRLAHRLVVTLLSSAILLAGASGTADAAKPVGKARTVAYGESPQQRYDVYRPPSAGRRPTVLLIHGGGWVSGNRKDVPCRV